MLRLEEALEVLPSPYASERYSPLTGESFVVVDFGDAPELPDAAGVERLRVALAQLPCPSLAVCSASASASAASAALLDSFDVALSHADEAAPLLETIGRAPLACQALVQLLRQGPHLSIHDALVSESLVYSTLQSGPEFAAWLAARPAKQAPLAEPGPAVRVERWQQQLVLSLNRPGRHNAFSVEMRDALVEGLQMAAADDSIEEVVLRAEGGSFCSGGDLSEFGGLPDPATAHGVRSTRNPGRLLARIAERVEARVHGACIGAGVELPAFARTVVAEPGCFFQLPELSMGLIPGAGGTASLPRRIGRQRTAWMALSGARVPVETAQQWGLVDRLSI